MYFLFVLGQHSTSGRLSQTHRNLETTQHNVINVTNTYKSMSHYHQISVTLLNVILSVIDATERERERGFSAHTKSTGPFRYILHKLE